MIVLGIDLRDGGARLAAARKVGKGRWEIASRAEVLPPDSAGPPDQPALLKAALQQMNGSGRNAVVVLGFQHVLIRRLTLPRLSLTRLRRLIERDIERYVPFHAEGANFDLRVLRDLKAERKQEIVLTAVPARLIQPLAAVCKEARLKLQVVDLDLVALLRGAAASGVPEATAGAWAVVEVAPTWVRMGLFQAGILLAGRSFPTTAEGAGEIAIQVRRSLEVLLSQQPGEDKLKGLALAGDVADGGLAAELLPLLQADIASRLDEGFAIHPVTPCAGPAPGFAAAFGAALAGAVGPRGLDLLPRVTFAARQRQARQGAMILGALAALGGYGWFWSQSVPDSEQRIRQAESAIRTSQEALKRNAEVQKQEARRKELSEVLLDMRVSETPLHQAVPAMAALAPAGLRITDISGQVPDLQLKGTATDPAQVAELLGQLAGAPFVAAVDLRSLTVQAAGTVNFDMTLSLKGQRRGGAPDAAAGKNP